MAWTTPHTWVAGEIPVARQFNTELRDNLRETAPFLVEAAGDFIVGSAANALRRIPIGAVGSPLTVSSGGTWAWAPLTVPTGAIIFYNGTTCPAGYTAVAGARGRIIVGLPAGGTVAGTVGTALTNLGTRTITTVIAHTHTAGTLAAGSTGAHTHTVGLYTADGGGAAADTTTTGSTTTGSSGSHTHALSGSSGGSGSASVAVEMPYIQFLVCSKD